jgi:hypothetical protein
LNQKQIIDAWKLEPLKPAQSGPQPKGKRMVVVSAKSGGKSNFTAHPEGQFAGVCVDVHDLGFLKTTWQGQEKVQHKIDVYFFCGEYKDGTDGKRYPLLVRDRFTATLSDKGRLKPFLQGWRGKKFTEEELQKFDLDNMIGAPALLTVEHNIVGDDTYANIVGCAKLPKVMEAPATPDDFVRFKDRKDAQETTVQGIKKELDEDMDSDLPF